jgi:hypothetical protein
MPVAAIAVPLGLWDVPVEAAAVGAALRQALAALVRAPIPDRLSLAVIRLSEQEALPPYWRRYYELVPTRGQD